MDNFMRKNIGSGPKNVIKMFFFRGFHTLLHENASQFYCAGRMKLKLTGLSPVPI